MPGASDFLSLTPLIPAGENLAEGVAYFTARLGFTVVWQDDNGAEVRRGAVALHLVRNGDRHWAENCSCVIGVADLDGLYAEYRDAGLALGALETKPWGRREFHMILPSGVCLQYHAEARSGKDNEGRCASGGPASTKALSARAPKPPSFTRTRPNE